MAKIMARFVHGCAEVVSELDVDQPDDPPLWLSLCAPHYLDMAWPVSEPNNVWEAVYIRQPFPVDSH
ncbi:hypothetical protein AB0B66_33125 [Catellatospora sp. NPDC049111]|uniref:hypothetical protein n=1 Tax=Catellatospora sp. NPDC049111 TaxID=3155271 RepID=UPI00340679AE